MARPHREQRRRSRRAGPGRRTAAAGRARARSLDAGAAPSRSRVRATVSAHRQAEVHRPERDLLEDRRRDPGPLRVRVLEADDDALARARAVCRPGRRLAVDRRASRSASRRSTPARGPTATRQSVDLPASFGPTSPTISPSSSARSMSWRTGLGVARRSGTRRPSARASAAQGSARERAGQPADDRPRPAQRAAAHAGDAAGRPSPGSARAGAAGPGRPNARTSSARLRSSTSVSDDRITGPTSGRTPRRRARTLPSVSRPRARWAACDHAGPLDHRRHGLERGERDEREPRREAAAARGRGRTLRGSVVSPNSPIDVEIANSRTSVWPAKSTPSSGRVERADREEDGRRRPG